MIDTDAEWSVLIFYRPVDCVPEDFNIAVFYDAPRAFGCGPMTVDTVGVWEEGVGVDPPPTLGRAWGDDVPIWLVRTDDLLAARADGVVTIGEIESLDPLKGTATFSRETVRIRAPGRRSSSPRTPEARSRTAARSGCISQRITPITPSSAPTSG